MKFYNRERETELLKKLKKDFRIAIVGGRRLEKTKPVRRIFKNKEPSKNIFIISIAYFAAFL